MNNRNLGYLATIAPGADMAHALYMKKKTGTSGVDHFADTKGAVHRGAVKGAIHGTGYGAAIGSALGAAAGLSGRGKSGKQRLGGAALGALSGAMTGATLGGSVGAFAGNMHGRGGHYQKTLDQVKHDSQNSRGIK